MQISDPFYLQAAFMIPFRLGTVALNRPLVAILDFLRCKQGVFAPLQVFHELQENMLMTFANMLLYDDVAAQQLSQRSNIGIAFEKLHKAGIQLTTEPFFRRMLLAVNRKVNCT